MSSSEQYDYKVIRDDLYAALDLVKEGFFAAGYKDRVDHTDGLIGAGEYEEAYICMCQNIHEFDIPVSDQAYGLFVKLWSEIGADVQRREGEDWNYVECLGIRDGFPAVPPGSQYPPKPKAAVPAREIQGKYPWNSEPIGVVKPGSIQAHENWHPTEAVDKCLHRLAELGVAIYSVDNGGDYTFEVPHQLFPEQYKEVEKLMDGIAQELHSHVDTIDWHPHGHKLRIAIPRQKA